MEALLKQAARLVQSLICIYSVYIFMYLYLFIVLYCVNLLV